jgi:hypothetical protein
MSRKQASTRHVIRHVQVLPAVGQACTNPRGCDQPALAGRWVCEACAADIERRGVALRRKAERDARERPDG